MFARVEEEEEALPRRCRDIDYLEIYVRAKFSKVLLIVKNNKTQFSTFFTRKEYTL